MDSQTAQQVFVVTTSFAVIMASIALSKTLTSFSTVPTQSVALATIGTVGAVVLGGVALTKTQEVPIAT